MEDKPDLTETRELLAHKYADLWPDHQYMPSRQGYEAGFVAGFESLWTSHVLPLQKEIEDLKTTLKGK